ncbi:MAG TPA: GNAT family N-acetyltransferase [Aestuariivirga sp.]|nr:GNAT family N-acetyltransferase [Aestuariivirga sp.]
MIEPPRLTLRSFSADDVPAMVAGLGNFAVARNTGRVPYPYGPADAEAFLQRLADNESPSLNLAIALKSMPEKLVGGIGLTADNARTADLGYWLMETLWNRGLGLEAARAITDHAFGKLGFSTLTASYHAGNDASHRILLRLGFVPVSDGLAYSLARDQEVPVEYMELARARWRQHKAAGL